MASEYFNNDNSMHFWCDSCDDQSTFYGTFLACIEEAKEEGWKIFMKDEVWCHKCPLCALLKNDATGVFGETPDN